MPTYNANDAVVGTPVFTEARDPIEDYVEEQGGNAHCGCETCESFRTAYRARVNANADRVTGDVVATYGDNGSVTVTVGTALTPEAVTAAAQQAAAQGGGPGVYTGAGEAIAYGGGAGGGYIMTDTGGNFNWGNINFGRARGRRAGTATVGTTRLTVKQEALKEMTDIVMSLNKK